MLSSLPMVHACSIRLGEGRQRKFGQAIDDLIVQLNFLPERIHVPSVLRRHHSPRASHRFRSIMSPVEAKCLSIQKLEFL